MGHASDCAVSSGPAFLPGPCDCGLEIGIDTSKLFRPLLVLGARGARWEIKQANVEALIEAEVTPIGDGRRITLTIDLVSAHGWPPCGGNANCMDVDDPLTTVIM